MRTLKVRRLIYIDWVPSPHDSRQAAAHLPPGYALRALRSAVAGTTPWWKPGGGRVVVWVQRRAAKTRRIRNEEEVRRHPQGLNGVGIQ